MTFDFKKEFKELYIPKNTPQIVEIPKINYIAVRGKGNPNDPDGKYANSIKLLYSITYTLRMSYKTDYKIDGFFKYVVPPLEGFWWQDNIKGVDYSNKDTFRFISIIRLPDFITIKDFEWAIEVATNKKKMDFPKVEFMTYNEGLCVQCMHIGPYDNKPETVNKMHEYLKEKGYLLYISDERYHHEIIFIRPKKM